jgi:hypothetical protein
MRLAQLAHPAQLLGKSSCVLCSLTAELLVVDRLGALWLGRDGLCRGRLGRRVGRGAPAGEQLLGLGALLLGLLDQAACLLGEAFLLLGRAHFFSFAPGSRQHLRFVGATLLDGASRFFRRLGGSAALGLGCFASRLGLLLGLKLAGGFRLTVRLALGGVIGGFSVRLFRIHHALGVGSALLRFCGFSRGILLLGVRAVGFACELLGDLVGVVVGSSRYSEHQRNGDRDNRAARNRPPGHCLLLA